MLQTLVTVPDVESTALAVKELLPSSVGVPVIAPVDEFRFKPKGREPVMEYVYGGVPPPAITEELYATASWAVLAGQLMVSGGCAVTAMLQLAVAVVDAESRTVAVKELAPLPVGVPAIAPVDELRLSPEGSEPPTENVYGRVPPAATSEEL
jgi:hypothetical protein